MSYMKLIKLLYFADRKYIKQTGSSITKDTYYSMKNGPVLSNVLNLINTEPEPDRFSYWSSIIAEPYPLPAILHGYEAVQRLRCQPC